MSEHYNDLGYCKGGRAEKAAIIEDKMKEASKTNRESPPPRSRPAKLMTHSDDIKQRITLLNDSMYKQKYTRDTGGPISKDDPDYGKPQKGTWTAERGARAHSHVHREILELCEVIYMNGYNIPEDEMDQEDTEAFAVITFGDLFKMYTRISDKVVGLLLRAKKYRLVYFEPEMLFQGQDEATLVYLLKPMKEIYSLYNKEKKAFELPK